MHFSIPDTQDVKDHVNSSYTAYNVHVNGVFHCTVRYRQLHSLHDQLRREYGLSSLPPFPPKKLLPLTPLQIEERRTLLEKYIQQVNQNVKISRSELFKGFLLNAQKESLNAIEEEIDLDVYLMNWQKVQLRLSSTSSTDDVVQAFSQQMNLPEDLIGCFSLFFMKKEESEVSVERKLQPFEAPYLSLKTAGLQYCLVIRKSYWDSTFDDTIMEDRVALNILYIQTVSDIERGWVMANKETQRQLASLQAKGSKKEYLQLARNLKFYGYIPFRPCSCNYPEPNSRVTLYAGGKELCFRLRMDDNHIKEFNFKVTRIRCWRITTHGERGLDGDLPTTSNGHRLELSFEYLLSKDKLHWVTVSSDQAILISMCLQGMVDELLLKKSGEMFKKPPQQNSRRSSWSYMKRDGSSYNISLSKSASTDGFVDGAEVDFKTNHKSKDSKKVIDKSSGGVKPSSRSGGISSRATVENDAFDGIGDDDL